MTRPVDIAPAGERIAKLLARAGVASRREVERFIAEGRIARDGVAIDTPATVMTSLKGVTVDGEPVAQAAPARLFLYHKPTGLLVTERDPRGRATIYDHLPADLPRVVPVGRLDLNTEGLLLLTNDGGLKRQLELPATGVERAYRARCYGQVSQAQLETLMEGIEIEGVRYGPINANLERRTGANTWIEMILTEGKNREVRRVLEYLGLQVGRLIRTRYGPFVLADLPPGEAGEVRQSDLVAFRQTLGGKRQASDERIAVTGLAKPTAARGRTPALTMSEELARTSANARTRSSAAPFASRSHAPGAGRDRVTAPVDRAATTRVPSGEPRRAMSGTSHAPTRDQPAAATRRLMSARSGTPSDPSGRRGEGARVATPSADPQSRTSTRVSTANPHKKSQAATSDPITSPRPAKIERKTGWAKPKPKTGPKRPGKR